MHISDYKEISISDVDDNITIIESEYYFREHLFKYGISDKIENYFINFDKKY